MDHTSGISARRSRRGPVAAPGVATRLRANTATGVPAGTGELQAINLHPSYWSRGLGSALFRASEAGLAELGYKRHLNRVGDRGPLGLYHWSGYFSRRSRH